MSKNLFNYYKSIKASNDIIDTKAVPKYFYEVRLLPDKPKGKIPNTGHYDWRFFVDNYHSSYQIQNSISHMLQTWLKLNNQYNLKTWIAHGTLLGWYFNGKSMPWDMDVDVQMPINDLNKLCLKFNQSAIMENPKKGLGMYFLDCGSSITHRSKENGKNNIDARLIDVKTGLYIDITGVSFSGSRTPDKFFKEINWNSGKFYDSKVEKKFSNDLVDPKNIENQYNEGYLKLLTKKQFKNLQCNLKLKIVNCRNNHFTSLNELLPLRKVLMEGVEAYVPNDFTSVLKTEYKAKFNKPWFNNKYYYQKLGNWIHQDDYKNVFRRFISTNLDLINKATKNYFNDDNKILNKTNLDYYAEIMGNQIKDMKSHGDDAGYFILQNPHENYVYPFNLTGDAEALMILDQNVIQLREILLSKPLVDYHYKELLAFQKDMVLSDDERSLIEYQRPDFLLTELSSELSSD